MELYRTPYLRNPASARGVVGVELLPEISKLRLLESCPVGASRLACNDAFTLACSHSRNITIKFRVYRASRTVCWACPAYGFCTKDAHTGRALWIGPHDALLRQHRHWMTTERAGDLYARRKQWIEPIFGIFKEQLGDRKFLLRGLANVLAEFRLLATAFNLRTLWRVWKTRWRPLVTEAGT